MGHLGLAGAEQYIIVIVIESRAMCFAVCFTSNRNQSSSYRMLKDVHELHSRNVSSRRRPVVC